MISKNLYFNLLREDMKRRIWTLALAMLAFVVVLPIYAMLRIDRMKSAIEYDGIEEIYKYFASIGNNKGIGLLFIVTIVGAFICGLSGFSYLYSKSKVDLYHSIPVKREKLFVVTYINGVITYVVPYLINIILYLIIGAANGLLTKSAVSGAILAFGVNLVGYLLIYSITIIAVMMTGNIIVGILGTAIFMIYGPVLLTIKTAIYEIFFKTYYQPIDAQDQLAYISPIFSYYEMIGSTVKSGFMGWFIGVIVVTVIAVVIGVILYRVRPSEAAGKSMSFKSTQSIIKILIVIPTAIVGGLLLMSMSETTSFAWMVFGIIFIGFLAHGIIESIYNIDFKCMIANKIQLVICIAIALMIAGAAKTDLFQYDSFIPDKDKVESMSVSFDNFDSGIEGYYDFTVVDSTERNEYNYINPTTYNLSHMELTNYDSAYQLAQYALENNIVDTEKIYENNSEVYVSFTVKYKLKNKDEKYRFYTVKLNEIMNYINSIYADENYKEGVYQILTVDRGIINSISYYNSAEDIVDVLKFTEEQKKEFLDVYTQELKTLTGTEVVTSLPVSQLICQIGNGVNSVSMSYYIYPQYTKTIEYMKRLGANLDSNINPDNIESINITDYNKKVDATSEQSAINEAVVSKMNYDHQYKQYTFTDRDEIEAISKAVIPDRLTYGTLFNTNIQKNLEVTIRYKYIGDYSTSACIIIDKLPDKIRQQIGY